MSTVPSNDQLPVDPDDEQLVAYLDNELSTSERDALEERLLEERSLRERLQQLQRSWDWLDDLPDVTPSDKMVETTLELVVSDLVDQSPQSRELHWRPSRPLLLWTAACVCIPTIIFLGVRWRQNHAFEQHLEDLVIAENLEAYLQAADLNLMRQLSVDENWVQMIEAAEEMEVLARQTPSQLATVSPSQREDYLAELTDQQRMSLADRWAQFSRLDPETKQSVRDVHQTVVQQTDADELVKTMRRFAAWNAKLDPEAADAIAGRGLSDREGAEESRREALEAAIVYTRESMVDHVSRRLDDDLANRIYEELETIVFARLADWDNSTGKAFDGIREWVQRRESISDPLDVSMFMTIRLMVQQDQRGAMMPPELRGARPDPLTDDELLQLQTNALTTRASRILDSIAVIDPSNRIEILVGWADEATIRNTPFRPIRADVTPLDRYLTLDPDRRDRIDLEDPTTFTRQLAPERPRGRGPGFGRPRRPGPREGGPPNFQRQQ